MGTIPRFSRTRASGPLPAHVWKHALFLARAQRDGSEHCAHPIACRDGSYTRTSIRLIPNKLSIASQVRCRCRLYGRSDGNCKRKSAPSPIRALDQFSKCYSLSAFEDTLDDSFGREPRQLIVNGLQRRPSCVRRWRISAGAILDRITPRKRRDAAE